MANTRIRFLRANANNLDSSKKLKAGQPLYIADKNYLTIGNMTDDSKASNAQPIDVRRIHGYTSDNSTITNTNTGEYKVAPYTYTESSTTKSGVQTQAPDEIKATIGSDDILKIHSADVTTLKDILPNENASEQAGRSIGSAILKFKDVYANNFHGLLDGNCSGSSTSCTGNSATASKVNHTLTFKTGNGDSDTDTFDGSADKTLVGKVVDMYSNQTISGTKTFSNTISGNINGNAATVTNGVYTTDFNKTGQTSFGSYIVEKKKRLFYNASGKSTSTSEPSITINLSESVSSSDVVEIVYKQQITNGIKRLRFTGLSARITDFYYYSPDSSTLIYFLNFPISISGTSMTINKSSTKVISLPNTEGGTVTQTIKNDFDVTIYSVYKIIE